VVPVFEYSPASGLEVSALCTPGTPSTKAGVWSFESARTQAEMLLGPLVGLWRDALRVIASWHRALLFTLHGKGMSGQAMQFTLGTAGGETTIAVSRDRA